MGLVKKCGEKGQYKNKKSTPRRPFCVDMPPAVQNVEARSMELSYLVNQIMSRSVRIVAQNVGADSPFISKPHTHHYDYPCGCCSPKYGRHVTEMSKKNWLSRLGVCYSWPISTCDSPKCWRVPLGHFDIPCEPVMPLVPA